MTDTVQFAQVADVQARTDAVLTGKEAKVNALLQDAAVVIRNYTGQTFVLTTATERIRPIGDKIKLPHKPVVSVNSVGVVDFLGNVIHVNFPYWDGMDEVWLLYGQQVINLAQDLRELFRYNTPTAEVNYTFGYPEDQLPAELITVSCAMVNRVLNVPNGGTVQSETTGPFQVTLSANALGGNLFLTAAEKALLDKYRVRSYTKELR